MTSRRWHIAGATRRHRRERDDARIGAAATAIFAILSESPEFPRGPVALRCPLGSGSPFSPLFSLPPLDLMRRYAKAKTRGWPARTNGVFASEILWMARAINVLKKKKTKKKKRRLGVRRNSVGSALTDH